MIIEQTVDLPAISDNSFFEDVRSYLNNEGLQAGKESAVILGSYNNLTWSDTSGMSDNTITDWGTKTLPGAGAFYFANHEDGNPTIGHLEPSQPDD